MPAGDRLGAVADHVDSPALADPEDGPDHDRIKKRVTDRVFIGSGVYSLGDVVDDVGRDLDLYLGCVSGGARCHDPYGHSTPLVINVSLW